MVGGIVTEFHHLQGLPSPCSHGRGPLTKGKTGMLGLENYPQSASRACESVRTVRAADPLAKNVCETCPPNRGCLVRLVRPFLPGKPNSLSSPLCHEESQFPSDYLKELFKVIDKK